MMTTMTLERIGGQKSGYMIDLCLPEVLTKLYLVLNSQEALRFMVTCHFLSKIGSPMRGAAVFACTRPSLKSSNSPPLQLSAWVNVWDMCASVVEAEGWPAGAWADSYQYQWDDWEVDLATYKGHIIDVDADSSHVQLY